MLQLCLCHGRVLLPWGWIRKSGEGRDYWNEIYGAKNYCKYLLFVLLLSNKSFFSFGFFFLKYELCVRLDYVICGWLPCSSLTTTS